MIEPLKINSKEEKVLVDTILASGIFDKPMTEPHWKEILFSMLKEWQGGRTDLETVVGNMEVEIEAAYSRGKEDMLEEVRKELSKNIGDSTGGRSEFSDRACGWCGTGEADYHKLPCKAAEQNLCNRIIKDLLSTLEALKKQS